MKKRILNIVLNCALICSILILFGTLISSSFNKIEPIVEAAEVDTNLYIKVDSNITVYASGDYLTDKNSKSYENFGSYNFTFYEYNVEQNTSIRLDAVNETKIFTNWLILDVSNSSNVTDVTSSYLSNTNKVNSSVTFTFPNSATTKLAIIPQYLETTTAAHKGLYFLDPYIIEEANDFDALSRIVNGTGTAADYAVFDLTASDDNREKLTTGYFKVIKGLTLNDSFESIGTIDNPFRGLFDGNNNGETAIISLNQVHEITNENVDDITGNSHFNGLFGVIADNTKDSAIYKPTLVRNIIMQGVISYQEKVATPYDNIYVGGVAGISGASVIIENITTKVDISVSTVNSNVYLGGIFGYSYTSLEQYRDIYLVSDHKNWNVSTNATNGTGGDIYTGTYAGYLANALIAEYDVTSTTFNISASALGNSGDVYLGLVVGYYDQKTSSTIGSKVTLGTYTNKSLQCLDLVFSKNCSLEALANNGNSYAGAFFGYINASLSELAIADIYFKSELTSTSSEVISSTKDKNSIGSVYVGGVVAYVNGFNLVYDETIVDYAKPIFDANINFIADQVGTASTTHGFSVAGGIVGRGYIDVNDSTIFLNSENSKINLQAIQDKFTVHADADTPSNCTTGSEYEHLSVGMLAGSFGKSSLASYDVKNFNLIANNYEVEALREEGSLNFGQITVGGLIGFTNDLDIDNCNLLLNNCDIKLSSLSYEIKFTEVGNNAYLGGVVGRYYGSTTRMATMSNVTIAGYNYDKNNPYVFSESNIGQSKVNILGVQNTNAGNSDYESQIYVGGFVGCTSYFQIKNCEFLGSSQTENNISLRGNNDIDSAMVGGIVGIARSKFGGSKSGSISSNSGNYAHTEISDCIIENVHIIAESSCRSTADSGVSDSDMYAGGIIGAVFFDNAATYTTDVSCDIIRNLVNNCTIETIGHNYMKSYTGGIIGGSTWNGNCTANLVNNIVHNNRISAISESNGLSYSAGVLAYNQNTGNHYINGCAVINNTIYSYNNGAEGNDIDVSGQVASQSAGILCRSLGWDTDRIINNYVSSDVIAEYVGIESGSRTYVICGNNSNFNTNYYNSSISSLANATYKNSAKAVTFTDITGIALTDTGNLYGGSTFTTSRAEISDDIGKYMADKDTIVPYTSVQLSNGNTIFTTSGTSSYTYKAQGVNGASNALLWINVFGLDVDYSNLTIDEAIKNGCIIFNSQKLVTINASSYTIDFDYPENDPDVEFINSDVSEEEIFNEVNKYGIYQSLNTVAVKLQSTLTPITIRANVLTTTTNPYSLIDTADVSFTTSVDSGNIAEIGLFNCIYNGDGTADIIFIPNNEYLDADVRTITITVTAGEATSYLIFKVKSNIYTNMQGRYSDTTEPLNVESETKTEVGELELGQTESNPYVYFDNTTVKIIPALKRVNEGDVFSDDNCPLVTYSVQYKVPNSTTYVTGEINPSGDLVIGNITSGTIYKVTVTLLEKYDKTGNNISDEVYISFLDNVTISPILKGCEFEGPFNAGAYNSSLSENYNSNYIFYVTPKSGFGDIPTKFNINIDDTDYDLLNDLDVASGKYTVDSPLKNIEIYDLGKSDQITSTTTVGTQTTTTIKWTKENVGFKVIIPAEAIVGNIEITIEYPVVYTLLFDVNLDFDNISESEKYLSFTATSAYNISDLIGFTRKYDATEGLYYYDLNEMIDSVDEEGNPIKIFKNKLKKLEELAPFGYSLQGWYLIEDASYVSSYGKSIEEILAGYSNDPNTLDQEMKLNANYTFYARWSFSIFLNEAPGTKITCSFPPHFLVKDDWNVDVPINNKKGFSFTINKDESFSGEAALQVHILIRKPGQPDQYILTEVTAERYHEDMYIYTVQPEDIIGVLVITTFSTSTDFIVGEKEDSVDEDIVPEDGVFTLRYTANHLDDETRKLQTFAFAENNINKVKKLKVSFSKKSVLGSDVYDESYVLPAGTEVKLYYTKDKGDTVVGYYKLPVASDSFYATDFKIINTNTLMFSSTETFEQFFNGEKNASEKYYFVITPPNGYSTLNSGNYLECNASIGYIDELGKYLSCKRYTYDSEDANKPNYFDKMNQAQSNILDDIACADAQFIVYKSRETKIESINDSNSIKYIDNLSTVMINDNIYTNIGDWRHQDKYFMVGVQVYIDSSSKTPINLNGLTINAYYNGVLFDSQTISSKAPKNAVYFQTQGTGEYTFDAVVTDTKNDTTISGFNSSTIYGLFVTLLESTSIIKPSMGLVRSEVVEVPSSYVAIGKLFTGLTLEKSTMSYSDEIVLPTKNNGNDVSWKLNGNEISGTIKGTALVSTEQNQEETTIVTLVAYIGGYSKNYVLTLTPNYSALLNTYVNELELSDHFVNQSEINSDTGYINDGATLVDYIELESSDKYDLLVTYEESMGNQSYILGETSSYSLRGRRARTPKVYIIYGWLDEGEVTITAIYTLVDKNGNEISGETKEVSYTNYNGKKLRVGKNASAFAKFESMRTYVNNFYGDTENLQTVTLGDQYKFAKTIVAFSYDDFTTSIDGVSWDLNDSIPTLFASTITNYEDNILSLVDSTIKYDRTFDITLNIVTMPTTITLNIAMSNTTNGTSYDLITVDEWDLSVNYSITKTGSWTYSNSNSRYTTNSKNIELQLSYTISGISTISKIEFVNETTTNCTSYSGSPSYVDEKVSIRIKSTNKNATYRYETVKLTFSSDLLKDSYLSTNADI